MWEAQDVDISYRSYTRLQPSSIPTAYLGELITDSAKSVYIDLGWWGGGMASKKEPDSLLDQVYW